MTTKPKRPPKTINFKNGGELVIFGKSCMLYNVPTKEGLTMSSFNQIYSYVENEIDWNLALLVDGDATQASANAGRVEAESPSASDAKTL